MSRAETSARMRMNWTSMIGATEGVLHAAGLVEPSVDTTNLMGLSGRAFHLTMDERCWAGCPTLYDWPREHAATFERVGVLAECFMALPDSPVYDAARRRAILNIKASLDRGIGVVLWGVDVPEFGVVYGYDDADGSATVCSVSVVCRETPQTRLSHDEQSSPSRVFPPHTYGIPSILDARATIFSCAESNSSASGSAAKGSSGSNVSGSRTVGAVERPLEGCAAPPAGSANRAFNAAAKLLTIRGAIARRSRNSGIALLAPSVSARMQRQS